MNILLIGKTGQLGWELERSTLPPGKLIAVDYPEIDLGSPDSIRTWVDDVKPGVILNAAAYTAVDQAETEAELAQKINGEAPGLLAELALKLEAVLIHFSTDFVFDGKKGSPYLEVDSPRPINVYGRSKLAGELAVMDVGGQVFIYRTSWLYSNRRDCFLTKVLRWARTQTNLKIVADQTGSPTWARTLAGATAESLAVMWDAGRDWREEHAGIYHTAGIGAATRYEWAERILALDPHREEQITSKLEKALSSDFAAAAERPEFSALDCSKFQTTFSRFYTPWDIALKEALRDEPLQDQAVLKPR